ncbi:choice-of-anchor A family protein [Pseudorhodoferax sp.]|uniref:choice-of-anchor A family protein n=1 Tax=Pseudorhodoferax sp. TaxID=1993553 RepID=UPI0039E50EF4
MPITPKSLLFAAAALCASGFANAAAVSLGGAADYNLVSFSDFASRHNSVGGGVAVAGNLTASGLDLNGNRSAAGIVVGGNLSYTNGTLNGDTYVGGNRSTQGIGFNGQWTSGDVPLDFNSLSRQMQDLSTALAGLSATGSGAIQWGGLYLTGSNSAVEVFNLSAAQLSSPGWSNLSQLQSGSTIIINVSGTSVNLHDGMLRDLSPYNVLLNFYEAETLDLRNIGLDASILAPEAVVTGSSGSIGGNVVVGGWDATITLSGNRYFSVADVAGYLPPAAVLPAPGPADRQADPGAEVPEPHQLALIVLGLAMVAVATRRRQQRARR